MISLCRYSKYYLNYDRPDLKTTIKDKSLFFTLVIIFPAGFFWLANLFPSYLSRIPVGFDITFIGSPIFAKQVLIKIKIFARSPK